MYRFVTNAQVTPYRRRCQQCLVMMQNRLRKEKNLKFEILLVGSGASGLVTRNGSEPFDLDYNLIFHHLQEPYITHPEKLKELIRHTLDETTGDEVSFGQDSTASITYNVKDNKGVVQFSFDVALIYQPPKAKTLCRLIHDKNRETYMWNEIRNSSGLAEKEKMIRKQGHWNELREIYLDKKNRCLSSGEKKPSFVLYIEAVNEVCQ